MEIVVNSYERSYSTTGLDQYTGHATFRYGRGDELWAAVGPPPHVWEKAPGALRIIATALHEEMSRGVLPDRERWEVEVVSIREIPVAARAPYWRFDFDFTVTNKSHFGDAGWIKEFYSHKIEYEEEPDRLILERKEAPWYE